MYEEIFKLDTMLTAVEIPHRLDLFPFGLNGKPCGFQIRIYKDQACTQEIDDCVCHSFSHGHELGLLETFRLNECEGYETAEQVFDGWLTMYAEALVG